MPGKVGGTRTCGCIMAVLPTHIVQELNVSTVAVRQLHRVKYGQRKCFFQGYMYSSRIFMSILILLAYFARKNKIDFFFF